ncbi:hypothetical protein C8Q80DRAFT_1214347, partial [Daedaleopsis nitida]
TVRWPSGLRRQTKVLAVQSGPKGRGFESHSHHCPFVPSSLTPSRIVMSIPYSAGLPIEVYESIIDAVYDDRTSYKTFSSSRKDLRNCCLVCRAWRPRSQMRLFYAIELPDASALYALVDLLDAMPSLSAYVRILHLIGRSHHDPRSVVALFPTLLMPKLPRLYSLSIIRLVEQNDKGTAKIKIAAGTRTFPYLPIHPRFPSLFAPYSGSVRQLYLNSVSFPSYDDFVGVLFAFRNLVDLRCSTVQWSVLGHIPRYLTRKESGRAFLPCLQILKLLGLGSQGTKRLLSALGPSLLYLDVDEPHLDCPTNVRAIEGADGLDLSSFTNLRILTLWILPTFREHSTFTDFAATTLSLASLAGPRTLRFRPRQPSAFTRAEYIDLLGDIGRMTEEILGAAGYGSSRAATGVTRHIRVVVMIPDSAEWRGWWTVHATASFPNLHR